MIHVDLSLHRTHLKKSLFCGIVQLGTALSIYGCSKLADENVVTERTDMELGSYVAHGAGTKPNLNGEDDTGEIAGFWGYLLQIIYQVKRDSMQPKNLE